MGVELENSKHVSLVSTPLGRWCIYSQSELSVGGVKISSGSVPHYIDVREVRNLLEDLEEDPTEVLDVVQLERIPSECLVCGNGIGQDRDTVFSFINDVSQVDPWLHRECLDDFKKTLWEVEDHYSELAIWNL